MRMQRFSLLSCFIYEGPKKNETNSIKGRMNIMNKKIITSVVLSAMILSNAAVFAAESAPAAILSAPEAEEVLVGAQTITVNNETVDLSSTNLSQYIFE